MNTLEQNHLEQASLEALTPDALIPYVHAVSTVHSHMLQGYMVHTHAGHAVVVGYTLQDFLEQSAGNHAAPASDLSPSLGPALQTVLTLLSQQQHIQRITLLAPSASFTLPSQGQSPVLSSVLSPIQSTEDAYYFLPLPWKASTAMQHKVLSMCRRAAPHIQIQQSSGAAAWTGAHQELMLHYVRRPHMHKDMASILQSLGNYCRQSPHVHVFSAYHAQSKELMGSVLGDFTSLHTAFYMFAFRSAQAVPGTAEALLLALLQEATQRGYAWCNLGLGINDGIRFFKEKWGALPLLPCVESTWTVQNTAQRQQKTMTEKKNSPLHWLHTWWRK